MEIYHESMTKVRLSNFFIRCWREEKDALYNREQNRSDIMKAIEGMYGGPEITPYVIALAIINNVERMAAVEVLNQDGDGDVLYRSQTIQII